MQPVLELFIQVRDLDGSSHELIDNVFVAISQATSSTFSARAPFGGVYNKATMELSFRVRCATNYYGSDCAAMCQARDDSNGHYTCTLSGQKQCLPGWSEPSADCTTRKHVASIEGAFCISVSL